jgi:glycosyltransferase involved in cell wall biosynthesis
MDRAIPAISVIIPCYNLGSYLEEAVGSVLGQTLHDFEVIVVDDGSTDEFTRLLLDNFDRPKTRLIRQSNQGLAAARNHGIRQAAGRYICCLDADDRLRPEFFERAFAVLETQPDVGFVTGYFQMFGEREDVFRYDTCKFPDMLVYNQAVEPAIFRRVAWDKAGGYCETFSFSGIEDWDLWLTILELGYRADVIPEIVWEYRIRSEQMSTKMYQPEIWERLCRELAVRHEQNYQTYMIEVVAKHAARWVELRAWANNREQTITWWEKQSENWQRLADDREGVIQEQQRWIDELERGKAWLDEQWRTWEKIAGEREQVIQEQKAWINELEKAKGGWEAHAENLEKRAAVWQHLAEDRLKINNEQGAWVQELERAKAWFGEQHENSQRLVEDGGRLIEEQRAWIVEMEKAKTWIEEQHKNSHLLAEERERIIQEQQAWIVELDKGKA